MIRRMIIVFILLFTSLVLLGQQDILLHLKINNRQKLTVYHDEPLLLSLSISNPKASEEEQWNRSANYKSEELDKAYYDKKISEEEWKEEKQKLERNKKKQQTIRIGPDTPLQQLIQFFITDEKGNRIDAVFMKLLDSAAMPAELILDANAYYLFRWGVDREFMRRLQPGKYFISTRIENYTSAQIELTIKDSPIPAQVLQTTDMQYQLGSFALQYGKVDSAIYHARKILKTDPSSIDALVLLGDAYTNKKNYSDALKQFQSALRSFNKQYPNSPEPPLYITSMIDWLKEQNH
jgi:tetratricopeptide (TPR) repeat protein